MQGGREAGLYETLVTDALAASLLDLDERLDAQRHTLRSAEAADRIALHLSRVIERAIATLDEKDRAQAGPKTAARSICKAFGGRICSSIALK